MACSTRIALSAIPVAFAIDILMVCGVNEASTPVQFQGPEGCDRTTRKVQLLMDKGLTAALMENEAPDSTMELTISEA